MTHRKAKAGHLYVVATQSGTVKFGISVNPKDRIKSHRHTMGRVSPIIYEWHSKSCGGHREIEASLVAQYGGEYVDGVSYQSIQSEIEHLIEKWDIENQRFYSPPAQIIRNPRDQAEISARLGETRKAMQRANFLIANDDSALLAYFLIPIFCIHLGLPHEGMPDDVRDGLANAISEYTNEELHSFMVNFFAGGDVQSSAMDIAGISLPDFYYEVAQ